MKTMKKLLSLLIVSVVFANISIADIGNTDLNNDYRVNLEDLRILVGQWLGTPVAGQSADINNDGDVDGLDFSALAADWKASDIPLVVNELMADNNDILADDFGEYDDWIEIYNAGEMAVNTKGMFLTDDADMAEPNLWAMPEVMIAPGEYILIWADNQPMQGSLHATFGLGSSGDNVILLDSDAATVIDSVDFDSQKQNHSYGRIPNGQGPWRDLGVPSPLAKNIPFTPGDIIVNEILAHSDIQYEFDWIELKNTADYDIDISGWFLSDSDSDDNSLMKYQIAEGTIIGAGEFLLFYQNTHFGNPYDPGCNQPFGFSENGEEVCLTPTIDGELSNYTLKETFGASGKDKSFGRYQKSTGSYDFTIMATPTPNAENSYPQVGTIVISEMMYNPLSDIDEEEYVELKNITSHNVTLYDPAEMLPWKFTDGIDYTFPVTTTIPAFGRVIVAKDPATFTSKYGSLPAGVQLLGPYDGKLSNSGEDVILSRPGDVDLEMVRHYIAVDRVDYKDDSPWPETPDGDGHSLSRILDAAYSNDPNNWQGSLPNPGN